LASLASLDPTVGGKKSKSKGKKKIPKPAKKNNNFKMRTSTDDTESLRAFEEFLLGKRDTQTIRKSHNGSFQANPDSKGENVGLLF
jgi:hypothetical protein